MKPFSSFVRAEDGATLIVGLMGVAFLAMIGIFATTTSTVETRVASNERNSKIAFYTAEMALFTGESVVEALDSRAELQEDTIPGHWGEGTHPAWHNLNWDSESIEIVSLPEGLVSNAALPRYSIEQRTFRRDSLTIGIGVPTGVHRFNVYARGADLGNRTQQVLQTVYAKRY